MAADQRSRLIQTMQGRELQQRPWPPWRGDVHSLARAVDRAPPGVPTEPTPSDAPTGRGDEPHAHRLTTTIPHDFTW